MNIIYYMPVFLKMQANKSNNKSLLDFCELFKVVSPNACLIDRVGGILETPFEISTLYHIPNYSPNHSKLSYNEICINRAADILKSNKTITIFYSGGLDSTVVVLSFIEAIQQGIGNFDQITIAASPFSIIENPEFWTNYILPNFKLVSVNDALATIGNKEKIADRYVMGENADQLFGSDIILSNFYLVDELITEDNISKFISIRNTSADSRDYLMRVFTNLHKSCPIKLNNMADLIWWLNYSCKWQSVALRTLCFTNFLDVVDDIGQLDIFETFFNTQDFQAVSVYGNLKKWADQPSAYNYKLDSRLFIEKYSNLSDYAHNKIKVPSLYRVLASESYKYNALGLDGKKIVKINEIILK